MDPGSLAHLREWTDNALIQAYIKDLIIELIDEHEEMQDG